MHVKNLENKTIIKWNIPSEPTINQKRNIMDIPTMPLSSIKGKDAYLRSSSLIGMSSLILLNVNGVNAIDGIFWTMFQTYIYPWFLDLATVFVAIKISQGFYQENRGGKDSGSGFSAVFTYGKWLLLFHMIPFFVKLMDEIGRTMSNHLG